MKESIAVYQYVSICLILKIYRISLLKESWWLYPLTCRYESEWNENSWGHMHLSHNFISYK